MLSDIEIILNNLRQNSILLAKEHKKKYLELKTTLKYYRLPIIIISALNSVFSVGLQPFINQQSISLINCGLAMTVGIIGSIELFFAINKQMELALISSKDYYVLGTDIYKFLSLKKENRNVEEKIFLDECYGRYIKLIEISCVLKKRIQDGLADISKLTLISNVRKKSNEKLYNEEPYNEKLYNGQSYDDFYKEYRCIDIENSVNSVNSENSENSEKKVNNY